MRQAAPTDDAAPSRPRFDYRMLAATLVGLAPVAAVAIPNMVTAGGDQRELRVAITATGISALAAFGRCVVAALLYSMAERPRRLARGALAWLIFVVVTPPAAYVAAWQLVRRWLTP